MLFKIRQRFRILIGTMALQFWRRIFYSVLSDIKINGKKQQPVLASGKGNIVIDSSVTFGLVFSKGYYSNYTYLEARSKSAAIKIGKNTKLNNSATIISNGAGITIGENCLLGTDVEIFDSDFHELKAENRGLCTALQAPVFIGDHVFIGNGVRILKGVNIGSGSTVATGAVVVSDIPQNSIAAGIPAKVVRQV